MKKLIASILLVMLALTVCACSSDSSKKSSAKPVSATEQATKESTSPIYGVNKSVQKELDRLSKYNFSGIIYAERDGETVASYAKGSLDNDVPITLDTPMPIGSISKQFCAAAIMKLQEQGKLSVDDKLTKYYPDYKNASEVTLHHMLCMRSGIPNLNQSTPRDIISMDKSDKENTDALFKWLFAQKLNFRPDSMYEYSNCNYTLLSNIVEKVSGETYIDFLRENFLTPLGMTHTGFIFELKDNPDWAKSFSYEPSQLSPGIEPGVAKGAGDIVSNTKDMTIWMNALPSGKIISKDSYEAMTTDYTKAATRYGYGLFLETHGGTGHGGTIGPFNSYDLIIEEDKLTLFVASNESGSSTLENQIDKLLAAMNE